ncbi:MAG: hypothetical protein K0R68_581 [Mycobacterium sp.]|nr:hypothetical protein [Mycobacterium sp.]
MVFDVTGRLSEGLAALDNMELYVRACAARGYHHPDLTAHSTALRDWYGTEDGLDLHAVDSDCVTLRLITRQAAQALDGARTGVAAREAAWGGEAGSAASEFLAGHAAAATDVVAAVTAAAQVLERLRDELWRLVDGKVNTTVAIDARTTAQRPVWSEAARDGGSAEVVDEQIRPWVESVIAGEWVPAMQATREAVAAAYRTAIEALSSRPAVTFMVPGDLGPRLSAPPAAVRAGTAATPVLSTIPAAALPGPTADTAVPQAIPSETSPPPPPPAPLPTTGALPPEPAAGPGTPPGGLTDPLGALLNPSAGALPSLGEDAVGGPVGDPAVLPAEVPPEVESDEIEPDEGEPDLTELREKVLDAAEDVAVDNPAEDGGSGEDGEPNEIDAGGSETDSAVVEPGKAPDCPEIPAAPHAPDPAAPVETTPPAPLGAEPAPDSEQTPCEIAADELPQVGE